MERGGCHRCGLERWVLPADKRSMGAQPSHHPAFSTPHKDISLDQILISTMYSTIHLRFISFFHFFFHDNEVGGVLLSWPRFFLFFDGRLVLLRRNWRILSRGYQPCYLHYLNYFGCPE